MRNDQMPPRFFHRLFRWYCHPKHFDFIEGDLLEEYQKRITRHGKRRADMQFILDVILLVRKEIIRPGEGYKSLNSYGMLKSYFTIWWRNLVRNKVFSSINTGGLAVGLAAAMLIALYVYDELNFNRMHPNADRTFRLSWSYVSNDGRNQIETTAFGEWGRRLKEEMPEVEAVTRVLHITFPTNVRNKITDKTMLVDDRKWIDKSFPKIFNLDLIKGSKEKFFELPNSMVLSESAGKELFGDEDPMGQIVTVNDGATQGHDAELIVTGVYRDFPQNSTFRNKYLFNLEALRPFHPDFDALMEKEGFETYVTLHDVSAEGKVKKFLNKLALKKDKELSQWIRNSAPVLVALTDLHFDLQATWDYTGAAGNTKYLTILSAIAMLILLIACINYMNLTTAKTAIRAREVGIRKSFGSSRGKLAGQFMLESAIMATAAFVVSFALAAMLLPLFNSLALKNFTLEDLLQTRLLLIFAGIVVFAALAGGSYPAIVLSSFRPITVLKSRVGESGAGQLLRKSLVTVQYAVSISLTIVAIVILRQVNLMHDSKLNEQGDQLMMLRFGSTMQYNNFFVLKNELLKDPGIEVVSIGDAFPRLDHWGLAELDVSAPELTDQPLLWNQLLVDYDFSKTFNIPVVAGRNFQTGNAGDTLSVLINEAAVRVLGLSTDKVIGANISISVGRNRDGTPKVLDRKVIGVVQDFPYRNMKRDVEPLILNPNPNLSEFKAGTMVYVKLPDGQVQENIQVVQSVWKKLFPETGLQYYFVNDLFGRLYKSEMTMSKLALNFSGLAILITMFGLFGLASYAAERRTKEIGVRKVHGASVWQIIRMMMTSFIRIFTVAAVIVVPLDYFVLREWLSSFRYRTSLDVTVFAIGLGVILLVTIISVSYETVKAAVANPVKTLRYE